MVIDRSHYRSLFGNILLGRTCIVLSIEGVQNYRTYVHA
jgi:hypothetical protein